jgi:hypothetical protein
MVQVGTNALAYFAAMSIYVTLTSSPLKRNAESKTNPALKSWYSQNFLRISYDHSLDRGALLIERSGHFKMFYVVKESTFQVSS